MIFEERSHNVFASQDRPEFRDGLAVTSLGRDVVKGQEHLQRAIVPDEAVERGELAAPRDTAMRKYGERGRSDAVEFRSMQLKPSSSPTSANCGPEERRCVPREAHRRVLVGEEGVSTGDQRRIGDDLIEECKASNTVFWGGNAEESSDHAEGMLGTRLDVGVSRFEGVSVKTIRFFLLLLDDLDVGASALRGSSHFLGDDLGGS